jgi:HlyD family secretion protein
MSVRRSLGVLTILTLLTPLVAFGTLARLDAESANGDKQTSLQFYTLQRGSVEVVVSAVGTIEADQVVNLTFTTPGRVSEVFVEVGSYVLLGDPLAQLDGTVQQIAYDQALVALQQAQLAMDDLLAPPDEGMLAIAQANIDAAWGAYNSIALAVTPAQIEAAELAYEQAQQAVVDAEAIRTAGAGGGMLAEAQVGQATFNLEIARLQLQALQNGNPAALGAAAARAEQAEAEMDRLLAGPTQAEIDQAQIAIDRAQADVDDATADLNRLTLTAPFEGIVSAVNIEVGALVVPSTPAAQLTDVSPLALTVLVDEIDVGAIREGMPARVTLDALPGVDFPAQLEQIALVGQSVNNIITYDARVTLNADDARIRVGMTAEASVVVQQRDNVLIAPNIYIRIDRRTDQAFVNLVQPDGSLLEVEVQLGLQGEDISEILSGVSAGDVLAVDLTGDTLDSIFGG